MVINMKRNVTMEEISDGRLYEANDLVKADCMGCEGCSACCRGMGNSIVLDPLDVKRLTEHLQVSFEQLLQKYVELNVVDGIILPNLKMAENEACSFLNSEGRCSIHPARPGICRMFPLGRYYEETGFKYFLQVHECPKPNKTKVKVKKWMDTPNLMQYETYIAQWHDLLMELEEVLAERKNEVLEKQVSMYLLSRFYMTPYESNKDFYAQFEERLSVARRELGLS